MLFDSRLGPYDLDSPRVFWGGSKCGQFSSLFMGAAGPATHYLVALRRGALADWAQISIGLIQPHAVWWPQSLGWGHDPGAGGRVESPQTTWLRMREGRFPEENLRCYSQEQEEYRHQMHMWATGHRSPWCSSRPPLSSGAMSLFLLLLTPAETSLLSWSSHCQNQAQTALRGNDNLSN